MTKQSAVVETEANDEVLKVISDLRDEAKSSFAAFKKKVADGAMTDPIALAREMLDLFSIMVDVTEATFTAHAEHFEWAEGVDDELDALKGEGSSSLLPTDAEALKTTLFALLAHVRASTGPDDNVPEVLKARVDETVVFIDSITSAPGDDEDDDDEEGDDEDETDEDDKN